MRMGDVCPVRLCQHVTTPIPNVTMADHAQKALNWAVTNADVEAMLELLVLATIDVDERDRACGMQTPLMRLCHMAITEKQRHAVLQRILQRDPDVNIRDSSGRTALTHACIAEQMTIVEYLSQVPHCDPAVKDNDGNTPLMHAVRSRQLHFVQTLLRCFYDRLDINTRNSKGTTAYGEAESKQDSAICRALVSEGGAVPSLSNPVPVSARQTPKPFLADLQLAHSPHLSSRASSTCRRHLDTLPPVVLPHRPRGPHDDVLSPRSVQSSTASSNLQAPPSIHLSDSLSETSSTVLLSLTEDTGAMHCSTMSRKNTRKKESASEISGCQFSMRRQQGKTGNLANNPQCLPDIDGTQSSHRLTANGFRLSGNDDAVMKPSVPPVLPEPCLSQDSPSSIFLPKLPEDFTGGPEEPASDKPLRRRRKNSASLPNLANTGAFLVSPHRGSSSSDNIAGNDAAAGVAESRALDWECGVRSSYRKENQDFKLPQLNVAMNGGLTTSDWCADADTRLEGSRLSSKGKSCGSGNALERMLYSSALSIRASRTFTSGD